MEVARTLEPCNAFKTNRLATVQCVRRDAHQPGRRRGEEPTPRNQGGAAHYSDKTTANVVFEGSRKSIPPGYIGWRNRFLGSLKFLKCESWPEVQAINNY